MPQSKPLKQADLQPLGEAYISISELLGQEPLPENVIDISLDENTRLWKPVMGRRPQNPVSMLILLQENNYKDPDHHITKHNIGLVSGLGGIAIKELAKLSYRQPEPVSKRTLGALTELVRPFHSRIDEAIGPRPPKDRLGDLVQIAHDLVWASTDPRGIAGYKLD